MGKEIKNVNVSQTTATGKHTASCQTPMTLPEKQMMNYLIG
jgi:hypothetical protein